MRAAVLALTMLAGAADAQSALKGHDTNAPVDFDAARIEVTDNSNQAVLTGAVKIHQGDLTLNADRVKIFYDRPKTGDPVMRRLDADGAVRLESPSERASGRVGIYDVPTRQITMIGDVVLTRGDSLLHGQRLAIDLQSGRATLDGGGVGGTAKAGQPAGTGGRVTGRFVVPQRAQ